MTRLGFRLARLLEPVTPIEPVSLDVRWRAEGNLLRVHLTGEIDLSTAGRIDQVEDAYLHSRCRDVELDLSRVTFCDCAGLEHLVRIYEQAARRGGRARLCEVPGEVHRLLWMTRGTHPWPVPSTPPAGPLP